MKGYLIMKIIKLPANNNNYKYTSNLVSWCMILLSFVTFVQRTNTDEWLLSTSVE